LATYPELILEDSDYEEDDEDLKKQYKDRNIMAYIRQEEKVKEVP